MKTENAASIYLAINEKVSERSKDIKIRAHHIRDLINGNLVGLKYVASSDKLEDMLTKPLQIPEFKSMVNRLMVIYRWKIDEPRGARRLRGWAEDVFV